MAVIVTAADSESGAVIRTCIGCRQRVPVVDLLRVVAGPAVPSDEADPMGHPSQAVLPDPRRHVPGRGAWLHPRLECVELAERRRAFGRALRNTVPLDPAAVWRYVESLADHEKAGGSSRSIR